MNTQVDYEISKELGECYLFMGDFSKAEEYYHKANQADAQQADPYLGLATIAVQLGRLDNAKDMYAKAAELTPSDKAFTGLALVEMEQGMHPEAFAHFAAALDENPGNMFAINGLVQEGYFLERLADVLSYLENAISLQDMESLRYTMAGCLTALGRDQEARKHLEVLLGMNPANQSAQELYARFAA